ncbi:hypothetical protein [Clostridium lacusfryxellense]|uniref:hypothetical protein n=1 Tax=Clostridium lacusfryxellense TaxID=205328 RepID=UPI001C0BEA37|nr:hypothetical protein [Clostridium lacusfryxellense]MBU3112784.1 hypothetical protein [Clostridium lacusfryxellense]
MLICYPDHYIQSTMPIINLDEDENITRSDEYISQNDDYLLRSDKYSIQNNMDEYEVYNTSRNIPVNIFEEIDQEYVNKTLNNI